MSIGNHIQEHIVLGIPYRLSGITAAESSGVNSASSTNASAMQSALDKLGTVSLMTAGTYLVEKTLLIKSNTRLVLGPGVVLKRASGVGAPLIKNQYCGQILPAVGFNRTSGAVAVNENNHTNKVGDVIFISAGAGPDATFTGLVSVLVVTANVWYYSSGGADGAGGTVTQYYNVVPVTRSIAGSAFSRTSNYVTVTDTAHTLKPGMNVYIKTLGASTDFALGIVTVSKVSANTWTYLATGANGVAVGTMLLNYEYNISISGEGVIDGNRLNNLNYPVNTELRATTILLGNVSNVTIGIAHGSSRLRAINLFNCANVQMVCKCRFFDTLVGAQFEGGARNVLVDIQDQGDSTIWELGQQTADDYIAFTGVKYAAGAVGNYDAVISPYGLTSFSGIEIRRLVAVNCLNGVKISADTSCPYTGVFEIGSVIGTLLEQSPSPATGSAIRVVEDGPGLTNVRIETISISGPIEWAAPIAPLSYIDFEGTIGSTLESLIVKGCRFKNTIAHLQVGFTIGMVDYDNCVFKVSGGSRAAVHLQGGSVNVFQIRNSPVEVGTLQPLVKYVGGSTGTLRLENLDFSSVNTESGAIIDLQNNAMPDLILKGLRSTGATRIGTFLNITAAVTTTIYAEDIDIICPSFMTTPTGNVLGVGNITLYAARVKWSPPSSGNFFQVGNGNWTLFAGVGLTLPAERMALFGFGTPAYRFHAPSSNAKINLNDAPTYGSANMAPQNGDQVYNSTAGVIPIGQMVRRAGAWTAL